MGPPDPRKPPPLLPKTPPRTPSPPLSPVLLPAAPTPPLPRGFHYAPREHRTDGGIQYNSLITPPASPEVARVAAPCQTPPLSPRVSGAAGSCQQTPRRGPASPVLAVQQSATPLLQPPRAPCLPSPPRVARGIPEFPSSAATRRDARDKRKWWEGLVAAHKHKNEGSSVAPSVLQEGTGKQTEEVRDISAGDAGP